MLRLQIAVVVLLRPWCHRNYSAVSAWPFRTCRHGRWSITLHLQFVSTDWNGGVRSVVQLRPGIALTTSDLLLASCQKGRSLFPHLEHSRGTVADQWVLLLKAVAARVMVRVLGSIRIAALAQTPRSGISLLCGATQFLGCRRRRVVRDIAGLVVGQQAGRQDQQQRNARHQQ